MSESGCKDDGKDPRPRETGNEELWERREPWCKDPERRIKNGERGTAEWIESPEAGMYGGF